MFRKRIVLLISMGLVICLAGCGEKDNTAVTSELETTVTETVEADSTEDSAEEEVTTEQEPVEQQTEENVEAEPQTVPQWAKSLDKTEPRLTIWRDSTKEGTILENGKEYTVIEGDQIVLCYEGKVTALVIRSSVIEPDLGGTTYKVFNLSELPTEPDEVEFELTVDNIDYDFFVSLVAESSTN